MKKLIHPTRYHDIWLTLKIKKADIHGDVIYYNLIRGSSKVLPYLNTSSDLQRYNRNFTGHAYKTVQIRMSEVIYELNNNIRGYVYR